MARLPTPLKFMMPGWYALVMGLAGLSLAWHRAVPLLGEMAGAVALLVGALWWRGTGRVLLGLCLLCWAVQGGTR